MTPTELRELELWQRELEQESLKIGSHHAGVRRSESALDADRKQRLLGGVLRSLRDTGADAAAMRDWIQNRCQALYPTTHPSSAVLATNAGRELLAEVEQLKECGRTADKICSHQISTIAAERDELRAEVERLKCECQRLGVGWREANGLALKNGLERTNVLAEVERLRKDTPTADAVIWRAKANELEQELAPLRRKVAAAKALRLAVDGFDTTATEYSDWQRTVSAATAAFDAAK